MRCFATLLFRLLEIYEIVVGCSTRNTNRQISKRDKICIIRWMVKGVSVWKTCGFRLVRRLKAAEGGRRVNGRRQRRGGATARPAPPPVRTPAAPLPHGRPHSAEQQCSKTRRNSTDPAAAQSAMLEDRTARVAVGERS